MRRALLIGCAAVVFVARGVVACGGDDTTEPDGASDATTNQDATSDGKAASDTGSDAKAASDASDASSIDANDASASDASDASSIDAADATMDAISDAIVVSDAMGSCIDGGVACPGSAPCCTNFASVNYGKCVLLNFCK